MPFKGFKKLEIPDLVLVEPTIYKDERGFFLESYKKSDFYSNGLDIEFIQDNHSSSSKGILRGLHFQLYPKGIGKLVRCLEGKVLDVAVDLRKNSTTYKKWAAVELSSDDQKALYVPNGFAHGFLTLSDRADVFYKMTGEYSPDHELGIRWNDPTIGVKWPIDNPLISAKDQKQPFFNEIENKLNF